MFLNKKNILIAILFFYLLIQTNFVKNIYQIISNNYEERFIQKYGFCSNEGVGYIEYIKNKFIFKEKVEVISFHDGPNLDWTVYNTDFKSSDITNNYILINYPGNNYFKKINYINKKLIINAEYDLRLIKAINYILVSNIDILENDNFLQIILKDGQKIIYQKRFDNVKSNNIIFKTEYIVDRNRNDFDTLNLQLEINHKNLKINKNYDISGNMLNQINIKDFRVLNQIENCYLVTKND